MVVGVVVFGGGGILRIWYLLDSAGRMLTGFALWSRLDGRPVTVTAAATPPPAAGMPWCRHALSGL